MGTLSDKKWVRIMADYSAAGVWSKDGSAADIHELPVRDSLRRDILAWQKIYESSNGRVTQEWATLGWLIAKEVKQELPDWTVVYFDEAKMPVDLISDIPRSLFEYEIE